MRAGGRIQYPTPLIPTSTELFSLTTGRTIRIPKATPTFQRWSGKSPGESYGGKPIVTSAGKPAFAELAILDVLQGDGWDGVWVDTYRNKYRRGYWGVPPIPTLPTKYDAIMKAILDHRGSGRSGTWDIFAWRGGEVLFVESKRAGKDSIRPSQVTWLESALANGHSRDAFLVVEWTLR